jgi:hypothetical protein
MDSKADIGSCPICGERKPENSSICQSCEIAFGRAEEPPPGSQEMDLSRYRGKMFPWEPCELPPALISGRRLALLLCCSLVLIIVMLALLRTPLPTCWEVG